MEYRIIQKYKELYSAEFDIVDSSNRVVGNILLTGIMGSQRGSFDIRFYDGIMYIKLSNYLLTISILKLEKLLKLAINR